MRGCGGDFFECGADRLGDQLQAGQIAHRGQDVGGVGAQSGALGDEAGLLETGQREVEEAVSTVVSARRSRKSASTLWWKPGPSSSMAMAYLKSMRQRTASAASPPARQCEAARSDDGGEPIHPYTGKVRRHDIPLRNLSRHRHHAPVRQRTPGTLLGGSLATLANVGWQFFLAV